ncbi:MAG: AAA family ATPase [Acidobacteriota bacterium]|nr:AAA family ATPase [Acidobacteriota bacterium]
MQEILTGYTIIDQLYAGLSSQVYRTIRASDDKPVILKVAPLSRGDFKILTRYRRELEVLTSLRAPNVIECYRLVKNQTQLILILEDFGADSLANHLRGGRFPFEEVLEIAVSVAGALAQIHSAHIIHKDINPSNIVYNRDTGTVKLIDFGISTVLQQEWGVSGNPAGLEGTPAYIAPEQTGRTARALDHRADLYAFGVTLYELFTGRLPFAGSDLLELVHCHLAVSPTPPRDLSPELPISISELVMKLLAKTPEERYQSAQGVREDLWDCLKSFRAAGRVVPIELGRHDHPSHFELPGKIYGRDREISRLREAYQAFRQGALCSVLVSGAGGIGKSSLVRTCMQSFLGHHGYFLSGKFDQLTRDVPYSALVGAFRDLIRQLLMQKEDQVALWRRRILDAIEPNGQLIVNVIPEVELIIGPQSPVYDLEPAAARKRFNLVFGDFVGLFCQKEKPLVLFLDDMQWADSASLDLIGRITMDPTTRSLMLIEAYRSEEVTATHPFMLRVADRRERGIDIVDIPLGPLEEESAAALVADALRRKPAYARPAAQALWKKTAGNPFFIRQLLSSLHADGAIYFDAEKGEYSYNLDRVEKAAISEDLAGLLAARLRKLPSKTGETLRLAAAIGNRFQLETLMKIAPGSPNEIHEQLMAAVRAGMIMPRSNLEILDPEEFESPLVYRCYEFYHDRIRTAAYAMIAEPDRARLHLDICHHLMAGLSEDEIESRIFEIASHMNKGLDLVKDPDARLETARLNLLCGKRAKASGAYEPAADSFGKAIELLGNRGWVECYALIFEAHVNMVECLILLARFEKARETIARMSEWTDSKADKSMLALLKIDLYGGMGDMQASVASALEGCRLLGLEIPNDRDKIERAIEADVRKIGERTAAIGIASLIDLPPMEDPEKIVLMSTLVKGTPAAYQVNQKLVALFSCKMIRLSLDFGNCPTSAYAYATYFMIRQEEAHAFGKLGLDLIERLDYRPLLSGVNFLYAAFCLPWVRPLEESSELLRRGVEAGLETGDHVHASFAAARRFTYRFFKGEPLDHLNREKEETLELLARLEETTNLQQIQPKISLIGYLCGEWEPGNEPEEEGCLNVPDEIAAGGNKTTILCYQLCLMIRHFYAGELTAALDAAREAARYKLYVAGSLESVEICFYHALIMTGIYGEVDENERHEFDELLQDYLQQLRGWSASCPANFSHMCRLVEAEVTRIEGNHYLAAEQYDRALALADQHDFVHIEALASELAGRMWLERDKPDFAAVCLERACRAYALWGANQKLASLQKAHFPLLTPRNLDQRRTTSTSSGSKTLDHMTVIKAVRAISSEIVLEQLLRTLTAITVENAGAQKGALILKIEEKLLVRATMDSGAGVCEILEACPLSQANDLPEGLINFVARTGRYIVLEDASLSRFGNDAYIARNNPKSVLCHPIRHKGRLTGVIYLENNLVSGAFTKDRLEVLNILLSQFAISLENASLYESRQQQAQEIMEINSTLTEEVAERKRAEQELSRYRDHLQDLVEERTRELEATQARLVDVARKAGKAEVIENILHNLGNAMNSVNVGTGVTLSGLGEMGRRIHSLSRVMRLFDEHADRLATFLTYDSRGQKGLALLKALAEKLTREQATILEGHKYTVERIQHMAAIIAAQAEHQEKVEVIEPCSLAELAEKVLAEADLGRDTRVLRDYQDLPPLPVDRHRLRLILENLVRNAKEALQACEQDEPTLRLSIAEEMPGWISIEVNDNGPGIEPELLTRIFSHGFTTRAKSRGFGLHNSANAARQLEGSLTAVSNGPGTGASLFLRFPARRDHLQTG